MIAFTSSRSFDQFNAVDVGKMNVSDILLHKNTTENLKKNIYIPIKGYEEGSNSNE